MHSLNSDLHGVKLSEYSQNEFEINFNAETFYGEQIKVERIANGVDDYHYFHVVKREKDDKILSVARTVWK